MPGVWAQWKGLPLAARIPLVVVPLAVVVVALVLSPVAGAAIAVFVVGVAAATVVFVKNRSDRINAALDALDAERAARLRDTKPD